MKRRLFLSQTATAATGLALTQAAWATNTYSAPAPSVVLAWNSALTAAIAATITGVTVAARAASMLNEAIYNAWAAYDPSASFTLLNQSKRPWYERRNDLKSIAIDHAAHTVLSDLFPTQQSLFDLLLAASVPVAPVLPVLANLVTAAVQTGQYAGRALLLSRHGDGSNQLGDLAAGAYADWTHYQSVNTPDVLVDPTRWQPLRITNAAGVTLVQQFLSPHWGRVRPFALANGSALRPAFSPAAPTMAEMNQLIALSAGLTDATKALVDFFANNPGSVTPPGQWLQMTAIVSARDGNSLDDDVKLFFAVGQAVLDASIVAWDAKRAFDTVRPITALRYYFRGQTIQSWGGPGLGATWMLGENWRPYQRATNPSPPFPEFLSGHSSFSAAASTVIAGLRGDAIDLSFTFKAGGVPFDPTVPAAPVTLQWSSLSAMADAAGLSRRYGGIHFARGDLAGRAVGRQVGTAVLTRCQSLFNNSPTTSYSQAQRWHSSHRDD